MNSSNNIIHGEYDPSLEPDKRGLGPLLFDKIKSHGDKVAMIDVETGQKETYSEMLIKIVRVAQNMQKIGITKKDVIALCSTQRLESCLPYLASIFIQSKVACLDPTLSMEETAHMLNLVRPTMVFCGVDSLEMIEGALKKVNLMSRIVVRQGDSGKHIPFSTFLESTGREETFRPGHVKDLFETAVILFSSGSTGLAKGVNGTHYGLISQQLHHMKGHDHSMMLYFTTLYWISAVAYLLISIFAGGTRLICKEFDQKRTLQLVEKYKVTYLFMYPYLVTQMVQHGEESSYDTSSLKSMVVGGGTIIKEHLEKLGKIFPNTTICFNYGQTENHFLAFDLNPRNAHLTKQKPLSVGRPSSGHIYKVVNIETGKVCRPFEEGELRFKSKTLTTGYYNNDKETEDSFDEEGYFKTGDICYYDDEHCFYIVDRIKEAMKYKHWHVIPAEIEGVILQHPAVKEAAVFGRPHPIDGFHPMAAVVLKANERITEEELIQFVNDRSSERNQLRGGLKFLEKLFYTPTGKIQRRKLRDLLIN